MITKRRKFFGKLLLFLFISTTLFINFLHAEHGVQSSNTCPACHFQNSTVTTNLFVVISLPQLTLLETLKTFEFFSYNQPCLIHPLSRSPPQA